MAVSIRRGIVALVQSVAPSAPPANTRTLYPKADGWYDQGSTGRELKVGPGPICWPTGSEPALTNVPDGTLWIEYTP